MRDLNALGGFNFYTEGGIVQGYPIRVLLCNHSTESSHSVAFPVSSPSNLVSSIGVYSTGARIFPRMC